MHIGRRIKIARISKGLTQEELAEKINKTRPLISVIEQKGKVSHYTLRKICEVLGLDIEMLESGVEETGGIYTRKADPIQVQTLQREVEHLQNLVQSQKEQIALYKEKIANLEVKVARKKK